MASVSDAGFWEDLYGRGGDGWDLRAPTPSLVEFVESTPPPLGPVAVPGCGRGHDARFLARRGYDVVGFDFAETAVAAARALAEREGSAAGFERLDVFSLANTHARAFDGVWEYTCFCAIEPRRRGEYVRTIESILRPGGWLLACFFPIRQGGAGPPFPVSRAEVRRLLEPTFRIERAQPPLRSPAGRRGQEWMVFARRL